MDSENWPSAKPIKISPKICIEEIDEEEEYRVSMTDENSPANKEYSKLKRLRMPGGIRVG